MPQISVLMAVYNDEKYVQEAIDSILSQSFFDLELIIVDDGSSDNSTHIINEMAKIDNRIKVISHAQNRGLTKSLNIGLRVCRGQYIARCDADDLCEPQRLQKQYDIMEKNLDIALCGSQGWYIDTTGKKIGQKNVPLTYTDIKNKLLYNNQFIHSSLFMRKDVLDKEGYYNKVFKKSQDYELVLRLARTYKVINLKERLVSWRVAPNSISWSGKSQELYAIKARWYAIRKYDYAKLLGLFHIILRMGWLLLPQSFKRRRYSC